MSELSSLETELTKAKAEGYEHAVNLSNSQAVYSQALAQVEQAKRAIAIHEELLARTRLRVTELDKQLKEAQS